MKDDVRTERLKELNELQQKKNDFNDLLNDLNSGYFIEASLGVNIVSTSYDKKYDGQTIKTNRCLFREYVSKELKLVEEKIQGIIKTLI